MPDSSTPPTVLTIAGSDSGGAAGLQADLKTFTCLGVYGMSAVTVVTAQNSEAVTAVYFLSPKLVAAQLTAVLSDYGAQAIKTGFIGRVELIETIAGCLASYPAPVVIDPVLVNHRGESMFPAAIAEAYQTHLLPLATLVTPNWREAELLTGLPVTTPVEAETAAVHLCALGAHYALVKGIRDGIDLVDVLSDGNAATHWRARRIDTPNTHGSGDTLSAAICAFLALGYDIETAVVQARQFTRQAIQKAVAWQIGHGHGPLAHFVKA